MRPMIKHAQESAWGFKAQLLQHAHIAASSEAHLGGAGLLGLAHDARRLAGGEGEGHLWRWCCESKKVPAQRTRDLRVPQRPHNRHKEIFSQKPDEQEFKLANPTNGPFHSSWLP